MLPEESLHPEHLVEDLGVKSRGLLYVEAQIDTQCLTHLVECDVLIAEVEEVTHHLSHPRVESLVESLWSIVPAEYFVEGLTDLIPLVVGVLLLLVSGQQLAQLAEVRHDTLTKRDERLLRHRCGGAHPIDQRLHLSHRVSSGADIPLLYRTRGDVLQHPEEC